VTVIASILVKKLYDFQTLDFFREVRKGSIWDLIIYGFPFAVIFTVKL